MVDKGKVAHFVVLSSLFVVEPVYPQAQPNIVPLHPSPEIRIVPPAPPTPWLITAGTIVLEALLLIALFPSKTADPEYDELIIRNQASSANDPEDDSESEEDSESDDEDVAPMGSREVSKMDGPFKVVWIDYVKEEIRIQFPDGKTVDLPKDYLEEKLGMEIRFGDRLLEIFSIATESTITEKPMMDGNEESGSIFKEVDWEKIMLGESGARKKLPLLYEFEIEVKSVNRKKGVVRVSFTDLFGKKNHLNLPIEAFPHEPREGEKFYQQERLEIGTRWFRTR